MRKFIFNSRGEISTIVVIGMLVLIGVASLLTNTLNKNSQTTQTRAAGTPSCATSVAQGASCSSGGEWCIKCTGNRGPCNTDAGVGVPFRCENGAWSVPSWGSECNVTCDTDGAGNNEPTLTPVPGSTCIYSQTGKCYIGVCFGQPCGYNLNCQYQSGYGQEVVCPAPIHGSNPTPTYVAGVPQPTTPQPTTPPATQPTNPPSNNPAPTSTPRPNTTDGRCTYIGDVDCITLTPAPSQCASPEIWCATLNRCTGRTSCPTPTVASSSCRPGQTKCLGSGTCVDFQDQCYTPTPSSCRPGLFKCQTTGNCVEFQDECPTPTPTPNRIYLPIVQSGAATPTPNQLFIPIVGNLGSTPTPTPYKVFFPIFATSGNITQSGTVTVPQETVSNICLYSQVTTTQQPTCTNYLMSRSEWEKLTP